MRTGTLALVLILGCASAPARAGVPQSELIANGMPESLAPFAARISSAEGAWESNNQFGCVGFFQACGATFTALYSGSKAQFLADRPGQVQAYLQYARTSWSQVEPFLGQLRGQQVTYGGKSLVIDDSAILFGMQFGLGRIRAFLRGGCEAPKAGPGTSPAIDGNGVSVCTYFAKGIGYDVSAITGSAYANLQPVQPGVPDTAEPGVPPLIEGSPQSSDTWTLEAEVAPQPRRWKAKDGAQEAHEAIRPAHFEVDEAGETDAERRLYALIRERAMASQLADARFKVRKAVLQAAEPLDQTAIRLDATGRTRISAGWMALAAAEADAGKAEGEDEAANPVPILEPGRILGASGGRVVEKKTKAPPRYTEATLVKALEAEGVGRPSTYAAIMETIVRRDYVAVDGKRQLSATAKGMMVVDALCGRFGFIELAFTRAMEEELDAIAEGRADYRSVVARLHAQLAEETAASEGAIKRPPSEAMIAKARAVAAERDLVLPEDVERSYAACRTWLDEIVGSAPSATQKAFAAQLAERLGEALDPAVSADRGKLSAWIDAAVTRADRQAKARLSAEPASEKQIAVLRTAIDKGQIETPPDWPSLSKLQASTLIDKVMSGGKRTGTKSRGKGRSVGSSSNGPRIMVRRSE